MVRLRDELFKNIRSFISFCSKKHHYPRPHSPVVLQGRLTQGKTSALNHYGLLLYSWFGSPRVNVQSYNAHIMTMHTSQPCTHLDHAHIMAMHTSQPCTHLDHAHIMAMHTSQPCTHLDHAHIMTMHTSQPCTHLDHAHIMAMHTSQAMHNHIHAGSVWKACYCSPMTTRTACNLFVCCCFFSSVQLGR